MDKVTVLPPRRCDPEVAQIMDELDRMQSWTALMMARSRGDPAFRSAYDLIQRTRALIVERCFDKPTEGPTP